MISQGWLGMQSEEESRAYLQARLIVLSKLMFGSFIALLGFMWIGYELSGPKPDGNPVKPLLQGWVWAVAGLGVALLVIGWRLLVRRRLSIKQLEFIDVFYVVGTGTLFAAAGVLAYDLKPSAYICVTYASLMVLLRATVVPSTGKRTAVVSTIACLPMTIGTVLLVYLNQQDIPGPFYVGGGALIFTMTILLATIGSNVLYGLRRQISEAMQLGQYTLDTKIGEGGNGAVYRARHALLRRPTAIKLVLPDRIDGETLDRFEREVQHMSQLTHANTVAVFDYGRSHQGIFYYAMEYLDGIDLEKLVINFGAQPADRVVPILIQVCGALAEAHRRGLIHRDIKPANIILSVRGDVPDVAKVVDFGLVKEVADAGKSSRGIMGTPAYIAPETVTDPDQVGPASDLYSLGAVAYFLITGKRVFDGKTSVDVCVQHVTAKPVPPSQAANVHVPRELEDIILRLLSKNPSGRPAGAQELATLLRGVPIGDAWGDAQAAKWWEEFRRIDIHGADTPASTRTMTIDIAVRTPIGGSP